MDVVDGGDGGEALPGRSWEGARPDPVEVVLGVGFEPDPVGDVGAGDYIEVGMLGAYGCAMRTAFNGFGAERTEIVEDEPMASLYTDVDCSRSNVVTL